jgi:hypothetical protein
MTLEIRVRVANHHKDEARGILPDIRRCDSSFCSLLAGLAYPTYDGVLVLANRAEEAIRGAIARSGGKPPSGAHLIEGLVGGGMIPLDPTGARVEIVVDYPGLVECGASREEIVYICAHEMAHCSLLRARSAIGLLEAPRSENPGAASLMRQLIEEYQAVVLGSSISAGASALSSEHSAATARYRSVGGQVYLGTIVESILDADDGGWAYLVGERDAGRLSSADVLNGTMVILNEIFVLLAHAQAFADTAATTTVLEVLPDGVIGGPLRGAWEQIAVTLAPFARLMDPSELAGQEARAVLAAEEALQGLLQALTAILMGAG